MAVKSQYLAYVLEQLADLGGVRSRRMFGGVGLYRDDRFFGLIDDQVLYFKVDDSNRADYLARGCEPFRPFKDKPEYSMSYFGVPPTCSRMAKSSRAGRAGRLRFPRLRGDRRGVRRQPRKPVAIGRARAPKSTRQKSTRR